MSAQSWTSYPGEKDGVKGTWYEEVRFGGPVNYRYVVRHFVADSAKAAVDTRNSPSGSKPWELYPHSTVS